jgi:hypothetical protein
MALPMMAPKTSAQADDQKVVRADTLFEMTAPKRQTKHVGRHMNEVDVQEAVRDQPPIFVPLQRRRIHRAVVIQQCGRRRRCAGLAEADAGYDDIGGE